MYPGIDIIEIERFACALERHPRLKERIFTAQELRSLQGKGIPSLAARFAGKEAVFKALGTGLSGFAWHDVEIISALSGEPEVFLSHKAQAVAMRRGGHQVRLSLAHDRSKAIAMAVLF